MSRSEPTVCSWIYGRLSTVRSPALLVCRRASRQSSTTKPVRLRKMQSKRVARPLRSPRTGIGILGFEIDVTRPDQSADMRLRDPMLVGEDVELMQQSFGLDPKQRVSANQELAGIVADDNSVVQEPMGPDAGQRCSAAISSQCDQFRVFVHLIELLCRQSTSSSKCCLGLPFTATLTSYFPGLRSTLLP